MFGTRRPAHEHDCRAVDTPGHAQPSVTCAIQGGPGITWRAGLRNMWTSDTSTAHSPAPNTKRAVRKIARNWGSLPAHAVSMAEPTSMVVEASLLGQWGGYQATTRLLLASQQMSAGGESPPWPAYEGPLCEAGGASAGMGMVCYGPTAAPQHAGQPTRHGKRLRPPYLLPHLRPMMSAHNMPGGAAVSRWSGVPCRQPLPIRRCGAIQVSV